VLQVQSMIPAEFMLQCKYQYESIRGEAFKKYYVKMQNPYEQNKGGN
jgi:hypothetical protein